MGRLLQYAIMFVVIRCYKGLGNFLPVLLPQA